LKKPKTPLYCPAWFVQVAERMVNEGVSFLQACVELNLKVDADEAEACSRRKEFQEILRSEKNKYHQMIANDPSRTKSVVLGQLVVLADKLTREGEYDKAAGVLEKLAKLEGWQGADSNVNIFAGLTAKDIAEARGRILAQQGTEGVATKTQASKRPSSLEVN